MKAGFLRNFFFTFSAVLVTVGMVLAFQNCSNDAGFNANPSVARPFVNTNPPRIGGNENVVIRLNQYPTDQTLDGGDSAVDFEVTDANGNPVAVNCYLDNQQIDCDPKDVIPINIQELGLGTHTFVIEAIDPVTGDPVTETITFTVFNSIVPAQKIIDVNQINDDADILIVVDNSGSMEYEQQSMAQRISNFMDKFKESNYRIAVTTTAPLGNAPNLQTAEWTDGKFLKFENGSNCIDKSLDLATAQDLLGKAVQRTEEGNGWERGIYMTVRAIERAIAADQFNGGCFRQGIAKHVIVISDEDETVESEDGQNRPLIESNKSEPQYIVNYIKQVYPNVVFKFHSIIVDPLDPATGPACLDSHGAKYGDSYAALSVLTGGVRGSVCAVDYATQLEQIGQSISDSGKVYALDCVAVANGTNPGSVTQGGAAIGIPWTFNGTNIEFAQDLPVGTYVVDYFCFQ